MGLVSKLVFNILKQSSILYLLELILIISFISSSIKLVAMAQKPSYFSYSVILLLSIS